MLDAVEVFYLCPTCFEARLTDDGQHTHRMARCEAGPLGDERRRPIVDATGRLSTRAPRWFVEAMGRMAAAPAN
jgi:hypothetical protein